METKKLQTFFTNSKYTNSTMLSKYICENWKRRATHTRNIMEGGEKNIGLQQSVQGLQALNGKNSYNYLPRPKQTTK